MMIMCILNTQISRYREWGDGENNKNKKIPNITLCLLKKRLYFDMKNIKPIPAAAKECLFCRKSASIYLIILLCMPNGRDDILYFMLQLLLWAPN